VTKPNEYSPWFDREHMFAREEALARYNQTRDLTEFDHLKDAPLPYVRAWWD
jgi:hypothetical protein